MKTGSFEERNVSLDVLLLLNISEAGRCHTVLTVFSCGLFAVMYKQGAGLQESITSRVPWSVSCYCSCCC